ncbi:universal stress protein [Dyadobacter fermentans]|uniref:universal stress protein n=1 Tax=Dyadobacter fermentans TaxID=94254 RepID=UPI001CBF97AF|nr:universal stress protein [Dyadobacter fermentans]MBZ1359220.1 universal stress protein [Dyadobacter fermentans]
MKRILVPCDFSAAAKHAFQFAVEMAAATGGRVFVLKIMQVPTVFGNGMPGQPLEATDPLAMIDEWIAYSEKEFEKLKSKTARGSARAELLLETGYVNDVIRDVITREKIDLVIMGTDGASGLKEFFIGSHTEKIVRASPVPVMAIHGPFHLDWVKNIVFPTTMELDQKRLVEQIKALQTLFGAVIHLLYVNGFPFSLESEEEAESKLEDYALFYGLKDYTVHVSRGLNVQEGILKYARRIPNSIIAMGTHGHKGLAHITEGSVAEDVVNHLTEPVWTYVMQ